MMKWTEKLYWGLVAILYALCIAAIGYEIYIAWTVRRILEKIAGG